LGKIPESGGSKNPRFKREPLDKKPLATQQFIKQPRTGNKIKSYSNLQYEQFVGWVGGKPNSGTKRRLPQTSTKLGRTQTKCLGKFERLRE
jgi:hypothetical protein